MDRIKKNSKVIFALAICVAIIACKQQNKKEGYIIKGTLKGNIENATVQLFEVMNNNEQPIDSTVIRDGMFQLEGKVESPDLYQLVIILSDTTLSSDNRHLEHRFYLENSNITFEANAATMPSLYYNPNRNGTPIVRGSTTQDLNDKLMNELKDINDKLSIIEKKYIEQYHIPSHQGKEDSKVGIQLKTEMDELNAQREAIILKFIKENPASPIAFNNVMYIVYNGGKTVAQYNELEEILRPHWKGTKRFEELEKELIVKKNYREYRQVLLSIKEVK